MNSQRKRHFLKSAGLTGLILVAAVLYWYGAVVQLESVNTNMDSTDQGAYLDYARTLYESNYTVIGGRNRMPVYPIIQSLFYRADMDDATFFVRGKYVNLVLSMGLLAGLAFVFHRSFTTLHSLNLVLIVAFTVFIFKAGYFQAELLFYFVNFCLFLLMWRLLRRMSRPLAILAGMVAGLAHLIKASILPGLVVFLVLGGLKWGWVTLHSRHSSGDPTPGKFAVSPLLGVLLVGAFFLITVFPYINTSKRVFGRYFYNVNSTFYMWYDSWDEAKQGTRARGDRDGWPDMPPEDIPSMSKYLREHTPQQIIGRFASGGSSVLNNVVNSYGYFKYIVIYSCVLIVAILGSWRRARQAMLSRPILCLFLLLYFGGYLLLYSWYAPIVEGNRLILAQFIPLMFTISCGLQSLLRSSRLKVGEHSVRTTVVCNLTVLTVVIADIYLVLTERVGTMYGGW